MSTFAFLTRLQTEIGSRRAGTPNERKAQQWLQRQAEALGLAVEMDPFTYVGALWYRPLMMLLFVLLITANMVAGRLGYSFAGFILLVLAFVLMFGVRRPLEERLARSPSHNVIAGSRRTISEYAADPAKGPAVLLCAHYDTTYNRIWGEWLVRLLRIFGPIALFSLLLFIVSWLAGLAAGVAQNSGATELAHFVESVIYWSNWLGVVLVAPLLLLLAFNSVSTLLARKVDTPGADDNGSGTSVVLELARRFSEQAPQNLELFYAWWGAEELGLFGSRQFVRRYHDRLNPADFHIVNIDCVGVGETLVIHAGQGILRRKYGDKETIALLERIADNHSIPTERAWETFISGGSSDHAAWISRGYSKTVTLLRERHKPASPSQRLLAAILRIPYTSQSELPHIHSAKDTLEGINEVFLEQTADVAEAYVRQVDRESGRH